METHGSFIKNFDDVKVAKAIAKELGISGNAASVDKTVNINFKVKGIEDLQLANKEAETLEAMLSNSRGKYLFSNQNNALKEVYDGENLYTIDTFIKKINTSYDSITLLNAATSLVENGKTVVPEIKYSQDKDGNEIEEIVDLNVV